MRHFWVLVHRYAGLTIAGFLILVGLTGSLLAFLTEINRALTPHLFPATKPAQALGLGDLALNAQALLPQARVTHVYVGATGAAIIGFDPLVDPATGKPYELGFNRLFLDTGTGKERGRLTVGGLPTGWDNLMSFIYHLHMNLSLGEIGVWVLGICALIWTLDCFVGFYLTLPARRRQAAASSDRPQTGETRKTWRQRWQPAWAIKWRASALRVNFDLHRAGGLWLWIVLLIFAWSSVYMNLHDQVYAPVTRLVLDYPPRPEQPALNKPLDTPALGWRQAHETATRLMADAARERGFIVERPVSLWIDRKHGAYHYFYCVRKYDSIPMSSSTARGSHGGRYRGPF